MGVSLSGLLSQLSNALLLMLIGLVRPNEPNLNTHTDVDTQ